MNWLAKDSNGDWYIYPKKPVPQTSQWRHGGEYSKYFGPRVIPGIPWEDSLQNLAEPGPQTQLDRIEEMLKKILEHEL